VPIITDIVQPLELTAWVRELPTPQNYVLDQFLPDYEVPDVEFNIDVLIRYSETAKYRTRDAETPVGRRGRVLTRTRGEIPPLGEKILLTEYERLMLNRLQGQNLDPLVRNIYDDAEIVTRAIRSRAELARGQVLSTGKLTLDENGVNGEIDYGVPLTHIVAPTTAWSDHTGSTPITDLLAWQQTYLDDTGELPDAILSTRTVVNHLLQNVQIRGLASIPGAPVIPYLNRDRLNAVMEAEGLPQIFEYDTRVNVDTVATRVYPANALAFIPADRRSLGQSLWGITAEALELAGMSNPQIELQDAPGIVAVVMKEGDPVQVWTKSAAAFVPVLNQPQKLFVASVF
jgi:hypothetical protein